MEPVSLGIAIAGLIATKAVESAAGKAGETGWSTVTSISKRLRGWFTETDNPDGVHALESVERAPENRAAQETLARTIDTAVSRDADLGAQLQTFVDEATASGHMQIAKFHNTFNGPVGRVIQADTYHEEA